MYLEKTLSKNEEIIKVVKMHYLAFFFPILFVFLGFAMLGGVIKIVGVIIIIVAAIDFLNNWCTEMVVTTKRVIIKKGILSASTNELKLEKIESISVNKTLIGMFFNYGNVFFSGTGTTKVKFIFVSNPIMAKKTIEDAIEEYQKALSQKN